VTEETGVFSKKTLEFKHSDLSNWEFCLWWKEKGKVKYYEHLSDEGLLTSD